MLQFNAPKVRAGIERTVDYQGLGYARWKRLHRLAYVAPLLGVIHFTWRVKRDVREPVTYAVVLGALLVVRLGVYLRTRLSMPASAGTP